MSTWRSQKGNNLKLSILIGYNLDFNQDQNSWTTQPQQTTYQHMNPSGGHLRLIMHSFPQMCQHMLAVTPNAIIGHQTDYDSKLGTSLFLEGAYVDSMWTVIGNTCIYVVGQIWKL